VVSRPARGPHRLKPSTWQLLIGCRRRFLEDQLQNTLPLAVAPSYKYKEGGEGMKHTTPNTTHLSSLWSLEAFILDDLGSLGGVERLEGE